MKQVQWTCDWCEKTYGLGLERQGKPVGWITVQVNLLGKDADLCRDCANAYNAEFSRLNQLVTDAFGSLASEQYKLRGPRG